MSLHYGADAARAVSIALTAQQGAMARAFCGFMLPAVMLFILAIVFLVSILMLGAWVGMARQSRANGRSPRPLLIGTCTNAQTPPAARTAASLSLRMSNDWEKTELEYAFDLDRYRQLRERFVATQRALGILPGPASGGGVRGANESGLPQAASSTASVPLLTSLLHPIASWQYVHLLPTVRFLELRYTFLRRNKLPGDFLITGAPHGRQQACWHTEAARGGCGARDPVAVRPLYLQPTSRSASTTPSASSSTFPSACGSCSSSPSPVTSTCGR